MSQQKKDATIRTRFCHCDQECPGSMLNEGGTSNASISSCIADYIHCLWNVYVHYNLNVQMRASFAHCSIRSIFHQYIILLECTNQHALCRSRFVPRLAHSMYFGYHQFNSHIAQYLRTAHKNKLHVDKVLDLLIALRTCIFLSHFLSNQHRTLILQ